MNAVRYCLASILMVSPPPLLLFWLLIHPFVQFWRKVGLAWTYGAVGAVILLAMAGLFLIRKPLLAPEFGTNYPFMIRGLLLLVVAGRSRLLLHRHVTNKVLGGLPELAPDRHPARLVT